MGLMIMKYVCLIIGVFVVVVLSVAVFNKINLQQSLDKKVTSNSNNLDNKEVLTAYPKEYMLYQDYLQVIGEGQSASPRYFDEGVIEATVLSLRNTDICPSTAIAGEICNIEPYPNDYATVRVDRIINYSIYNEQLISQSVERPIGTRGVEDVSSTQGNRGIDYPKQKNSEFVKLQNGQNVSVHFILTARPVKVGYVSLESKTKNGGLESQQKASNDLDSTQTVRYKSGPGRKFFQPISKEGGYFAFTTKIVSESEVGQRIFPGLKIGDKFRASIKYDGTVMIVGEYEMTPFN